ncbi:MAG: hypothetical protein HN348_00685 [Proteobacteria bacterium]|nr:hypothetical protein [Pseudomonadota bacterium]
MRFLQYTSGQRRPNFKSMGMDDDMADATTKAIGQHKSQIPRFKKQIEEQASVVADVFCTADASWPPPYSSLSVLVKEENAKRIVIRGSRLLTFEDQPWYSNVPLQELYTEIELAEKRAEDATLMGVSALLLSREADAIEGNSPWSRNLMGTWSFAKLKKDPKTGIHQATIDYFSLMHLMTELANDEKTGICY